MVKLVKDIVQTFSSIFTGMGITWRYLGQKPVTQQYPHERWALPDRYRGFVHNDVPRCTACLLCAKACPVDCIYIEVEGKGKERQMTRYAIDYNKCIWCSLCTEPCPTNCINDFSRDEYLNYGYVFENQAGEVCLPPGV